MKMSMRNLCRASSLETRTDDSILRANGDVDLAEIFKSPFAIKRSGRVLLARDAEQQPSRPRGRRRAHCNIPNIGSNNIRAERYRQN